MEADSRILEVLQWPSVVTLLGGAEAIDGSARDHGALLREREVTSGVELLKMGLTYASEGHSLRSTAAWSALALGVEISDVALRQRLRRSGDFLAAVCGELLRRSAGENAGNPLWPGAKLRLVDSSVFSGPGAKGGQLRLHASYDPLLGRFADFDLTGIGKGESLSRTGIEAGAIYLAERNYAKTKDLRQLEEAGAAYAIRAGIRSMRMLDAGSGERLTGARVRATLGGSEHAEIPVRLVEAKVRKAEAGRPLAARLLMFKASPAAEAREKARIGRSRTRHGVTPTPETESLAGIVMIVTNLPAQAWPADTVAKLYRLRWQIELAFKSLKSTFRMREVPAKDPALARSWILANLAAALLANLLESAIERSLPPSAGARRRKTAPDPPLQASPDGKTLHPADDRRRSPPAAPRHPRLRNPQSNARPAKRPQNNP
jgi:Transposase DDE domain